MSSSVAGYNMGGTQDGHAMRMKALRLLSNGSSAARWRDVREISKYVTVFRLGG
jgi:hypothetical protein